MSCAARLVGDGPLRPVDPAEAAAYKGKGFVWVHIDGGDQADLATLRRYDEMPDIAANALVATETRPRCDRIEDGAIVHLRGAPAQQGEPADHLVPLPFWLRHARVPSFTPRPLAALTPPLPP